MLSTLGLQGWVGATTNSNLVKIQTPKMSTTNLLQPDSGRGESELTFAPSSSPLPPPPPWVRQQQGDLETGAGL